MYVCIYVVCECVCYECMWYFLNFKFLKIFCGCSDSDFLFAVIFRFSGSFAAERKKSSSQNCEDGKSSLSLPLSTFHSIEYLFISIRTSLYTIFVLLNMIETHSH